MNLTKKIAVFFLGAVILIVFCSLIYESAYIVGLFSSCNDKGCSMIIAQYLFLVLFESFLVGSFISALKRKSFLKTFFLTVLTLAAGLYLFATILKPIQVFKFTKDVEKSSQALNKDIESYLANAASRQGKVEDLKVNYDINAQSRFFTAGEDGFYILNKQGDPQKIESDNKKFLLPSKKAYFALSGRDEIEIINPETRKKVSLDVDLTDRNESSGNIEFVDFGLDGKHLISRLLFDGDVDIEDAPSNIIKSVNNLNYNEYVYVITDTEDGSTEYVRQNDLTPYEVKYGFEPSNFSSLYFYDKKNFDTSECRGIITRFKEAKINDFMELTDGLSIDTRVSPGCIIENNYIYAAMSDDWYGYDDQTETDKYRILKLDKNLTEASRIMDLSVSKASEEGFTVWYLQSAENENVFYEVQDSNDKVAKVIFFNIKTRENKTIDTLPLGKHSRELEELER